MTTTCPVCNAEEQDLIGHEVRGVYDGVLYWSCCRCLHAWNRWSKEYGRRHEEGERFVALHNQRLVDVMREHLDR